MSTVETLKQLLVTTGATWVLWLLFALAAIALCIVVERWLFYRSREGNLRGLAQALEQRLDAGDRDGALKELGQSRAVAAAIAAAGLKLADRGPQAGERAVASAVAYERTLLERWLIFLGTLGNNAPFVGLFGTVIGVIQAFEHLGEDAGDPSVHEAAHATSQAVMSSIAEALVTTAVGLLVALPAVVAYNVFYRRMASMLASAEVLTNLVLAHLHGHKESRNGRADPE